MGSWGTVSEPASEHVVRLIADDLTGAADAGAALMRAGHRARIVLTPDDPSWSDTGATVVIIDSDTREADAPAAVAALRCIAAKLPRNSCVFKKIDSSLRGNIPQEVAGLRAAIGNPPVIFSAAFPQGERYTRNGVQYIGDVPLHHSRIWANAAVDPPRSTEQVMADLASAVVPLNVVRAAAGNLAARLEYLDANHCAVALCDAETDQDLDAIVEAALRSHRRVMWVGAAGLAAAVGRALYRGAPTIVRGRHEGKRVTGFLAIIGSHSDIARRQAYRLIESGAQMIELSSEDLALGDPLVLETLQRAVCDQASKSSTVVIVAGRVEGENASIIGRAFAQVTTPAIPEAGLLILSGGATARKALNGCGIRSLELLRELEPGVVLSQPDRFPDMLVVTKSGSFGDDETLVRVTNAL